MRLFPKEFTLLKGRCQAHKTRSEKQALTEASCSPSPLLLTWPPFPAGLPPGIPCPRGPRATASPTSQGSVPAPFQPGSLSQSPALGLAWPPHPPQSGSPRPAQWLGQSRRRFWKLTGLLLVELYSERKCAPASGHSSQWVLRPSRTRHQRSNGRGIPVMMAPDDRHHLLL